MEVVVQVDQVDLRIWLLYLLKIGEKIFFSSSTFNIQHLEDPRAREGQRAEGHQLVLAFCLCLTPFFRLVIKFFVLPFRAVKMSVGKHF